MGEVQEWRAHPTNPSYIEVLVDIPQKAGAPPRSEWFTPDMDYIRRRLRLNSYDRLIGCRVPIPKLQELAHRRRKADRPRKGKEKYAWH